MVLAAAQVVGSQAEETGLLRGLEPTDRQILSHRYGFDAAQWCTYTELAAVLGVSAATVRRRERAALATLRRRLAADQAAA